MSNGTICCLYAVCCPPGGEKQREAFVTMAVRLGIDAEKASQLFDALADAGAAITTKDTAEAAWKVSKLRASADRAHSAVVHGEGSL